jgi:hypothetical protein
MSSYQAVNHENRHFALKDFRPVKYLIWLKRGALRELNLGYKAEDVFSRHKAFLEPVCYSPKKKNAIWNPKDWKWA